MIIQSLWKRRIKNRCSYSFLKCLHAIKQIKSCISLSYNFWEFCCWYFSFQSWSLDLYVQYEILLIWDLTSVLLLQRCYGSNEGGQPAKAIARLGTPVTQSGQPHALNIGFFNCSLVVYLVSLFPILLNAFVSCHDLAGEIIPLWGRSWCRSVHQRTIITDGFWCR